MRSKLTRHFGALFSQDVPHLAMARAALRATAPATPRRSLPREFSWHDYAVYLLHIAAEIEHSLMVQYLYAAYSLGGPSVPADKRSEVVEWQDTILGIAKEEMGHLLTVQNVLRLIGGSLNLDREDFPWDIPFYPFDFALEPLTRASLAKFVFAEAPAQWPPDVTQAERSEIEAAVHTTPSAMPHRVGELYDLMIDVLSDREALPDSVFREETIPYQASSDEWSRNKGGAPAAGPGPTVFVQRVSSRSDAVSALTLVARQGEWPEDAPAVQEISHFRRFLKVFRAFPAAESAWSPTWQVPSNPQAPGQPATSAGPMIKHSEAGLWALLFNIRYRMLLTYLAHSFRISADPMAAGAANPRSLIIQRTFNEMYNLRSIAGILVQLPLNNDGGTERAGPPFQIPYSMKLPAEEVDCWRLHVDLIEAAERLLEGISALPAGARCSYATTVRSVDLTAKRQLESLVGSARQNEGKMQAKRSIAI
jgi:hypothetical protein